MEEDEVAEETTHRDDVEEPPELGHTNRTQDILYGYCKNELLETATLSHLAITIPREVKTGIETTRTSSTQWVRLGRRTKQSSGR